MKCTLLEAILTVATFVQVGSTAPAIHMPHAVHEKRHRPHRQWVKRDRIHKDFALPVRIGLAQSNLENGYKYVMDVSDPDSPRYGKYWTSDQIHDRFAPSQDAVDAVRAWLNSSGIADHRVVHSENKGWLAFDAYAHEAERVFDTEYFEHHHLQNEEVRVGCDEYRLPEHLRKHIDYITPGVKLSAPIKRSKNLDSTRLSKRSPRRTKPPRYVPIDGPTVPSQPTADSIGLAPNLRDCGKTMTPACLKALYHIPNATVATPGNSLGIFEGGDYYSQQDINLFFKNYAPWVPQGTSPTPAFIDGGSAPVAQNSSVNGGESDLDLNIAYSIIYPQTITLYQVDDAISAAESLNGTFDGFLNTFLDALDGSYCNYTAYNITGDSLGLDPVYPDLQPGGYKGQLQCGVFTPTNVISISYGEAEVDLPANYEKRQCDEFMKLALQGHTVLLSSGDYGVATFPNDSGNALGCIGSEQKIFSPSTPNCPYITSVGATRLYAYQTIHSPESAMQAPLAGAPLFSSSGGFSNTFPRPHYQNKAISKYFDTATPSFPSYDGGSNIGANGGVYNKAGRGFPDVSANGAELEMYYQGQISHFYGTSLAAPLWGSIITLINEARYANGKGPVGFLNAVLYKHPEVFTDIKNGSNPGCNSEGFKAVPGWDPITGLGTPIYPKLEKLFLGLP